jgi:hypothetical protein
MLELNARNGSVPTVTELSEVLDEVDQTALDLVVKNSMAGVSADADEGMIDEYLVRLELVSLRMEEHVLKESANEESSNVNMSNLMDLMKIQDRIKLLEQGIRSGKPAEEKEVGNSGNR